MTARDEALTLIAQAQRLPIGSVGRTDLIAQATALAVLAITEPQPRPEPQPEAEEPTPKQAVEQAIKARRTKAVKPDA